MFEIATVKARGRAAFKANYWACVIVAFIYTLFFGGSSASSARQASQQVDPSTVSELTPEQQAALVAAIAGIAVVSFIVGILIKVFLTNPLEVGCSRFFQRNVQQPGSVGVGAITEGFGGYGRTFVTLLLRDLFIGLWTLLLVVPGIMKVYSYRLVPYIVKDEPNLSASDVLRRSEELMRGNRWKAFLLDLSFIGWHLMGLVTLGIGMALWTAPYTQSTNAALYLELTRR